MPVVCQRVELIALRNFMNSPRGIPYTEYEALMRWLVNGGVVKDMSRYAIPVETLSLEACAQARRIIEACPNYRATPLRALATNNSFCGNISYKDEGSRFALSSFKALGGVYAVLRSIATELHSDPEVGFTKYGGAEWQAMSNPLTFTCATDGNHGLAVAAGARLAGARAVIFVHESIERRRFDAIKAQGAEICTVKGHYDEAVDAATAVASTNNWRLIADTCGPANSGHTQFVMHGYCVLIAEAIVQAGGVDGQKCPFSHIYIQAGVGGLAAAIAGWLWLIYGAARPSIIVVEPDRADCLYQTALAGKISHAIGNLDTSMTMLACGTPSFLAWKILSKSADAFLTISDEEAHRAVQHLFAQGIKTTTSGACGYAGFLSSAEHPGMRSTLELNSESHILVVGTEGPNDQSALIES